MPIHRGPRLNDLISRLPYATPVGTNIVKTWPNLAAGLTITPAIAPGGAWVEFISAANAPTTPFIVSSIMSTAGGAARADFQIGIGGAGAEVVVSSGYLPVEVGSTRPHPIRVIPGGTRVAVRASNRDGYVPAWTQMKIVTELIPPRLSSPEAALVRAVKGGLWYPGTVTIGGDGSPSSSASVWTYGSFAQIIGATEAQLVMLMAFTWGPDASTPNGQVGISTGAAASEVVFAEVPSHETNAGSRIGQRYDFVFPIIIPPSVRLAVKYAQSSGATGVNQVNFTKVLAGVYP